MKYTEESGGTRTVRVREVAESIQYGHTASASASEEGPRFLRITDIQNGAVDWDSVPSCDIAENDIPKYRLAEGDLVFARTGATTGKSFLIRKCPDAVFASYLIRVRASKKMVRAISLSSSKVLTTGNKLSTGREASVNRM